MLSSLSASLQMVATLLLLLIVTQQVFEAGQVRKDALTRSVEILQKLRIAAAHEEAARAAGFGNVFLDSIQSQLHFEGVLYPARAFIKTVNHPACSDGAEQQQGEGGKENAAGADLAPHSVRKGRLGLEQEGNFIVDCILAYDINNGAIAAYPPGGRPTQGAICAYPTIRSTSPSGTPAIRRFLDAVLCVRPANAASNRPRKGGFRGNDSHRHLRRIFDGDRRLRPQ